LKKLLKSLGELRQAKLTPETTNLYATKLLGYDLRHASEAIMDLGLEPRAEYQPAFPDIGTILARVEAIRDARTPKRNREYCGHCFAGYLIFNEDGSPHHRVRDAKRDTFVRECECRGTMQSDESMTDRKTVAAGVQ
jgi:hypothetical protein